MNTIHRIAVALAPLAPALTTMAQPHADPAALQQAQSAGGTIGKVLGMLLFGYVVLRLINRPRDGAEDTGRHWRIGVLLVLLVFMVGVWLTR